MKSYKIFFIAIGFVLIAATFLTAQDVEEIISQMGTINWSDQIIRAKGKAFPDTSHGLSVRRAQTIEKAKKDAYQNLLRIIRVVRIHGELKASDLLAESDKLKKRLELIVRHYTVEDIQSLETGEIEVSISFPMYGALSDLLLVNKSEKGEIIVPDKPLCPVCGQYWPEGKPVPDGIQLIAPWSGLENNERYSYTGLIIDVRGYGFNPALAPRIFNQAGQEIYNIGFANRRYAVEIGLVGYTLNESDLKEDNRVKDNPLFVTATGVEGNYGSDIILSNEDARIIHGSALNKNFFERCRVLLLID
ncbi:hypothetical protein IIC38_01460 [candidate division KSB1 bacterium]|nr:hypothetical protein [candidate division KSB1 bacterium]